MSEPWTKVEELYHAALEREPSERDAFLEKACAGDEAVRREVQSLLAADERAGRFIQQPAADAATQAVREDESSWLKRRIRDYEIVSLIGAGGMGEVYRARDTKLDRDVALKVLPKAFAQDPERVTRFQREARLLAALNHPNVATIHGLEESEGRHVLVLELIEGETLAARIARGPIPIAEALPLFGQIAAGLEAAHEKGIIHRDLKPANVTITPKGQVKVLDFGLAKEFRGVVEAESDLATASASDPQTGEGRILGTMAYMSPEQARGQAVDKRTDVWAFGCVMYEALTGRRAFEGGTLSDTLALVLQRDVDWEALPDGTPAAMRSLLRRCLQKDRDRRLHDIADARIEMEETPASSSLSELQLRSGASSPTELVVASTKTRPLWAMGLLALVAIVAGVGWSLLQRVGPSVVPGEISSVAVLPLTNLAHNPEQDYFVEGMQEELIFELSRIRALRVISRTSTAQYKNTEKPLPEIAEELQVDALVEGSVLRSEDQVRITLQLVALEPERHLWSSRYDRQLSNILALHSEVAQAVAREIRVAVTPEERALLATTREINPQAYDAYLKGLFYWNKWTPEGTERSAEWFRQSIAVDPSFAPAWAGLSRSLRFPVVLGMEPGKERLPLAHEASLRAVELDPSSAEARASLGMSECLQWNWLDGERDLQQALELDPNYSHGHHAYANLCLLPMGRLDDALAEMQRAIELDPLSLPNNVVLGQLLYYRGEYDQSIERLGAAIELDQSFALAHLFLGNVYREKGLYQEAVEAQETAVSLARMNWLLGHLGSTYAESGRRNEALTLVDELEQKRRSQYVSPNAIAMIYASLGEIDRAFEWFDRAYEERDVNLNWFVPDPRADVLRPDPRFEELLRKMRLPEEAIQRYSAVH